MGSDGASPVRLKAGLAAVLGAALVACSGQAPSQVPTVGSESTGPKTTPSNVSPSPQSPSPTATCLPAGTDQDIQRRLSGAGAVVELCRDAVFTISSPVRFTAANQVLRTQGADASHPARLQLASTTTTAINGVGESGIAIEYLVIDGQRPQLGQRDGEALVEIGGVASNQAVRFVTAKNTRSWSTIHIAEGGVTNGRPACNHATISDNMIGPAGTPDDWADGISLACADSLLSHNTVVDATDGGIVVFGAAGSTIVDNHVIAIRSTLLGGINLVDFDPVGGNYVGTTVRDNVIESQGALIKVGIAMGPQVWGCGTGTNFGATVIGNTVTGDKVGYGFPVNGVRDWTVTDNVDTARHTGLPGPGCGGLPAKPGAFQYDAVSGGTLQPGYSQASLTYLLGVYEAGTPPTSCGVMYAQQLLSGAATLISCDGRFRLVVQSGRVTLTMGATVLWRAPTSHAAELVLRADGNLVALDASGHTVWSAGTGGHAGARLALQDDGNLVVYTTSGNDVWASGTVVKP